MVANVRRLAENDGIMLFYSFICSLVWQWSRSTCSSLSSFIVVTSFTNNYSAWRNKSEKYFVYQSSEFSLSFFTKMFIHQTEKFNLPNDINNISNNFFCFRYINLISLDESILLLLIIMIVNYSLPLVGQKVVHLFFSSPL